MCDSRAGLFYQENKQITVKLSIFRVFENLRFSEGLFQVRRSGVTAKETTYSELFVFLLPKNIIPNKQNWVKQPRNSFLLPL
jgi:hypothetical protein